MLSPTRFRGGYQPPIDPKGMIVGSIFQLDDSSQSPSVNSPSISDDNSYIKQTDDLLDPDYLSEGEESPTDFPSSQKRSIPPSPAIFGTPVAQLVRASIKTTKTSTISLSSTSSLSSPIPKGTAIICPHSCFLHNTGKCHQECITRLEVLCGLNGVLRRPEFHNLHWIEGNDVPPAELSDILRVHDVEYIMHLQEKANEARMKNESIYLDADTIISPYSYESSVNASGAVCLAVDKVVSGEYKNVFVAIRPPGHHAGCNGAVQNVPNYHLRPDMCSNGFCLLNNLCIGAAYAKNTYGRQNYGIKQYINIIIMLYNSPELPLIRRIAIIDFDIHHGNGTEDIIHNLLPRDVLIPLPGSWKPLTKFVYKPWLDENDYNETYFCSIHLYNGDNFYPCSGSDSDNSMFDSNSVNSTATTSVIGSDTFNNNNKKKIKRISTTPVARNTSKSEQNLIVNIPMNIIGPVSISKKHTLNSTQLSQLNSQASSVFKEKVTNILLPSLDEFKPDLIFLSSGFDGHIDDLYYYLNEEDYSWLTNEILNIANKHCDGRVISVLEGGYNVTKIKRPSSKRKIIKQPANGDGSCNCGISVNGVSGDINYTQGTDCGLSRCVEAHVMSLLKSHNY